MTKKTYSELLRDPRWQKKRLEILQRDEFTCQNCMDSESTLNVHHCFYERGSKPWEHPIDSLVTLCESCHEEETLNHKREQALLCAVLCRVGFLSHHISSIAIDIYESNQRGDFTFLNGTCKDVFASALGWAIANPEIRRLIEEKYFENLSLRRGIKIDG